MALCDRPRTTVRACLLILAVFVGIFACANVIDAEGNDDEAPAWLQRQVDPKDRFRIDSWPAYGYLLCLRVGGTGLVAWLDDTRATAGLYRRSPLIVQEPVLYSSERIRNVLRLLDAISYAELWDYDLSPLGLAGRLQAFTLDPVDLLASGFALNCGKYVPAYSTSLWVEWRGPGSRVARANSTVWHSVMASD